MEKTGADKKPGALKRFFLQFIEKVDKKMEEKAKNTKCCCQGSKKGDSSCCS